MHWTCWHTFPILFLFICRGKHWKHHFLLLVKSSVSSNIHSSASTTHWIQLSTMTSCFLCFTNIFVVNLQMKSTCKERSSLFRRLMGNYSQMSKEARPLCLSGLPLHNLSFIETYVHKVYKLILQRNLCIFPSIPMWGFLILVNKEAGNYSVPEIRDREQSSVVVHHS